MTSSGVEAGKSVGLVSIRLAIQLALNKVPEEQLAEVINDCIPMNINTIEDTKDLQSILESILSYGTSGTKKPIYDKDEIEWGPI